MLYKVNSNSWYALRAKCTLQVKTGDFIINPETKLSDNQGNFYPSLDKTSHLEKQRTDCKS